MTSPNQANQPNLNSQNPENPPKFNLAEYQQWVKDPITQAFLAVLKRQAEELNNLKLATLPVTQSLPELMRRKGQAEAMQAVATLRGLKEVLCRSDAATTGQVGAEQC